VQTTARRSLGWSISLSIRPRVFAVARAVVNCDLANHAVWPQAVRGTHISDCDRVLVKTSVVRPTLIRSTTSGSQLQSSEMTRPRKPRFWKSTASSVIGLSSARLSTPPPPLGRLPIRVAGDLLLVGDGRLRCPRGASGGTRRRRARTSSSVRRALCPSARAIRQRRRTSADWQNLSLG